MRVDAARRGNQLDVAGWANVADALMGITSCTLLNGCDQFAAIREGGLRVMKLEREWELGSCAWKFVERSSSTLTRLDVRCATLRARVCTSVPACLRVSVSVCLFDTVSWSVPESIGSAV